MAQPTDDKLLFALKAAIAGITSPAVTVTLGAQLLANLPANTVQLTPGTVTPDQAGGGKTRRHLMLIIGMASRIVGAGTTTTEWVDVLTLCRAVVDQLGLAATETAMRAAGAEQTRRSEMVLWVKPPGHDGSPAGGLLTVWIDWTE